jgi:hypothetical protein
VVSEVYLHKAALDAPADAAAAAGGGGALAGPHRPNLEAAVADFFYSK